MPRLIDQLPAPDKVRPVTVSVISVSRSGTLGLYQALQILGFRAYHVVEALKNGEKDLQIMTEAMQATWWGWGKPYGRAEFDKWFANYDAIVEIGSFVPDEFVANYPDSKYILTERDPDAWVKSWKSTIGAWGTESQRFPLGLVKYFDGHLYWTFEFVKVVIDRWTGGKGLTEEGYANSRQFYIDYIKKAKTMVPPEKLLCVKLENGLGWQEICPFLGVDIPDTPWPTKHTTADFGKGMDVSMAHHWRRAYRRMAMTAGAVVAAVGTGVWYFHGIPFNGR